MTFTDREFWTIVHGMGFGALYLLAFSGALAGLWSLKPALITAEGIRERTRRGCRRIRVRPRHVGLIDRDRGV